MTQHRAKRAWAALKEDEMPTRIELLETANRQANGHITELSNQLAEKYAEIEKLKKENAELLDQRIKDLATLASEHRAIRMAR